jgi:S1-C subfamily serine protease
VLCGTAAATAGLVSGDVIIAVNGQPVPEQDGNAHAGRRPGALGGTRATPVI